MSTVVEPNRNQPQWYCRAHDSPRLNESLCSVQHLYRCGYYEQSKAEKGGSLLSDGLPWGNSI